MSSDIADALMEIAKEIHRLVDVLAGVPIVYRGLGPVVEVNEHGRCAKCGGSGMIDGFEDYCDCQLGRDLRRVEVAL